MKHWVLFDLDGTLTDSMIGITSAVKYALSKYGIEVQYLKELTPFIGPPLKDSFMKYYGFSEEQAREAIGYYREYYGSRGMFENEVYPGIKDLLSRLEQAGFDLAVATSKPTVYTDIILKHFGLTDYFTLIVGSEMDGSRIDKVDIIKYILRRAQVDLKDVIMVGDRYTDIHGAKQCGIDSIGVLYGFGSREELESAGADYIVDTVADLEGQIFKILEEEQRGLRRIGSWNRRQPEQVESFAFGGRVRFAVIGTDTDAERFCQANRFGRQFELVAVCGDTMSKALEFSARKGRLTCFESLDDLSAWGEFDAVYISGKWKDRSYKALSMMQAEKHVLCKAPMAGSVDEMEKMYETAKKHKVILMEGIPFLYAPAFEQMLPYMNSLGKIRHATLQNCHYSVTYEQYRRAIITEDFDPEQSAGALAELGFYPLAAMIRLFGAPNRVKASMLRLKNGMDVTGTILLTYPDMIGEVIYSKISDSDMPSQVQGEDGSMLISEIDNIKDLRISRRKVIQSVHFEQSDNILHHETNAFMRMIHTGLGWEESRDLSLETMRVLEEARKEV